MNALGNDFNIYETQRSSGAPEFGFITVSVSLDGTCYFAPENQAAAIDVDNDEPHTNPAYRQSYGLPAALSFVRFVRIVGDPDQGTDGLDLDAHSSLRIALRRDWYSAGVM